MSLNSTSCASTTGSPRRTFCQFLRVDYWHDNVVDMLTGTWVTHPRCCRLNATPPGCWLVLRMATRLNNVVTPPTYLDACSRTHGSSPTRQLPNVFLTRRIAYGSPTLRAPPPQFSAFIHLRVCNMLRLFCHWTRLPRACHYYYQHHLPTTHTTCSLYITYRT